MLSFALSLALLYLNINLVKMQDMLKFKVDKIVRDRSYADMACECSEVVNQELSPNEFQQALKLKLKEECIEVFDSKNKQELIEELADVLEVIEALARAYQINFNEIKQIKAEKLASKGGFNTLKNCLYLIADPNDPKHQRLIKYCQDRPEKYPAIP